MVRAIRGIREPVPNAHVTAEVHGSEQTPVITYLDSTPPPLHNVWKKLGSVDTTSASRKLSSARASGDEDASRIRGRECVADESH